MAADRLPEMIEPDERWYAALAAAGAATDGRDEAFADLAAAYGAGPRHFHTFDHASAVVDAALAVHSDGDNWAPVVLAAWYHDAVYEPLAPPGLNEGASAVLAQQALAAMRVTLAATGEVVRLICLTAGHVALDGDRNGALLCDADLSTLAADGDTYDSYVAGIRAEFAHIDDASWIAGRRHVLRSFLDRPTIFQTPGGRERWETRARINISSELESLG